MANRAFRVALATTLLIGCCGVPLQRSQERRDVIKKQAAAKAEFPWQAQLKKRGSHECGAILISRWWLLTAAHCLSGLEQLSAYEVVLGEHDVTVEEGTEQRRQLELVQLYSGKFGDTRSPRSSHTNDIALIKISEAAVFNEWVKPITLPESTDSFSGSEAVAAGWGASAATAHAPIYPRLLHKVAFNILGDDQCQRDLIYFNFVASTMVCAEPLAGAHLCWGDSGGALVHRATADTAVLAAITSWGVDCGLTTTPSVFVDVPHHVMWIHNVTGGSIAGEV